MYSYGLHNVKVDGVAVGSDLLDLYGGASFAYSFRTLRSAYSGNLIRARESLGNTEQNIGFVDGVLDTTSLLTFTGANSGFTPILYDQSTNANNLTQTTAANQLEIVNAGALVTSNSLAATQGSSSTGGQTSSIAFSGMSDIWFFDVVDITTTSGNQVLFESSANQNTDFGGFLIWINNNKLKVINKASSIGYVVTEYNISTGRQLISVRMRQGVDKDSFSEVYINGTQISLDSSSGTLDTAFVDNVLYLGARAGTSLGFTGKRQASIFYPSNQSSNRVGIETNLNNYYGIY